MSRKSGRPGPPTRRGSTKAIRLELYVFREGLRTEETYLAEWHRRYRDRVLLTIDPTPAGPLQLVERAIECKRRETREAKRGRGRAHDQIWCVFDRDDHPSFDQAMTLAVENGINVAVSNPCIELWFLLHFQDWTAFIGRRDVQRRAAQLLGCNKILTDAALDILCDHYPEAVERAQKLDAKHAGDGSPAGSNPSSSVWLLIEEIRNA